MSAPCHWPQLSSFGTGLADKRRSCGRGRLFNGLLQVNERCDHYDLNLSSDDTGGGATVFVILILGDLVVALAIWLEAALAPLPRAHLLVWLFTITVLAVAMLLPFKVILIGLHLKNLRHKYEVREDG